ncbi:Ger(x)C family spore germination protein [Bacillus thuringiensis]|nr:Ger(x)C family spore germination protein [Bacillus thuringiensis]MED3632979.1 Ger(x)C family spore germination protein [Bacillus thuringiensis]
MKISKTFLISIICLSLLTGCWDQNLLKDVRLVMSAGFDLTSDGKFLNTITIPLINSGEGGIQVTESQVVSAKGDTPRDVRNVLNNKISEQFDTSKLMVLLLGEEYAKQDIYPGLDIFYRDPKSSLIGNILVVKGRANDLLNAKLKEKKSMSEFLSDSIRSAQAATIIPQKTRPLISDMLDPGADFVLPLIERKENEVKIKGLAMFNEHKYTGYDLTVKESTLYLLMAEQKSKSAWIKFKVHENKEPEMKNFILINVLKSKRNLKVNVQNLDDISVDLLLDLKVEIMEYPEDRLDSEKKNKDLNKKLSGLLTKKANDIIKKMQKANSDSLAIGRHLIAYHHDTWEKINWEEEYPNVNFKAKVNVEISKHGIFN